MVAHMLFSLVSEFSGTRHQPVLLAHGCFLTRPTRPEPSI